VTVTALGEHEGRPLHICTPLLKETRQDERAKPRLKTQFQVSMEGSNAQFHVRNGTDEGLTLVYKSKNVILSANLGNYYDFRMNYKGQEYVYSAKVKHIQYNWKSHEHVVGIAFDALDNQRFTILNLLIDPNYKIDISHKETIDPVTGKIVSD
jgi:hypothetical protein